MAIFSVSFLWIVGLALVTLVPLKSGVLRRWMLALINLSVFPITSLAGPRELLIREATIVFLCLAACAFLHACAGRFARLTAIAGIAASLFLFVDYKLPWIGNSLQIGRIHPILVAIGFSYVVLRFIDATRAVYERSQPPPELPSTINYLIPFHMLLAGPIQAFDESMTQPAVPPAPTVAQSLAGMERIAAGVFKKYVIAHGIEQLFLTGFHATDFTCSSKSS